MDVEEADSHEGRMPVVRTSNSWRYSEPAGFTTVPSFLDTVSMTLNAEFLFELVISDLGAPLSKISRFPR